MHYVGDLGKFCHCRHCYHSRILFKSGLWPTSPVMDLPSSDLKSTSNLGRTAFSEVVVLTQVMSEAGQDPEQVAS